MDMPNSARDRIFAAADALYAESERQTFPTVDAVRKNARVNMNDASTGMKEWRRAQTAHIEPVKVEVPATLQSASANVLQQLWTEALTLANDTLRAAQLAWNAERVESESLREQIANAFESQACELETSRAEIQALRANLEEGQALARSLRLQADKAMHENVLMRAATDQANARAVEIEKRADDLRQELDRTHAALIAADNDLVEVRRSTANEMERHRKAWEHERQMMVVEEVTLRSELGTAREQAAELRGALAAFESKRNRRPASPTAANRNVAAGS